MGGLVSVLRVRLLAAVAVLVAATWLPVGRSTPEALSDARRYAAFDTASVTTAFPPGLTPPAIEPDLRLLAVVAVDIDADGDFDVVANDGSLNLVVWINDGTGRLTRTHPDQKNGWRAEPSAPTIDDRPITSGACAPSAGSFVRVNESTFTIGCDGSSSRLAASSSRELAPFSSGQIPRAPPASVVLT